MLQKLFLKLTILGILCAFHGLCQDTNPNSSIGVGKAAKNCLVEVRVTDMEGNPIQNTSVFLTTPYTDEKIIDGKSSSNENKSVHSILIDDSIGLYVFYAVAPGHKIVSFPIIVKDKLLKIPDITLPKTDDPVNIAISQDAKICKWAYIWQGYVTRKRQSQASFQRALEKNSLFKLNNINILNADIYNNNWGPELHGLSKEIASEKNKDTKAFLSACYIELGLDSTAWQPLSVDQALRYLDDISPFWSLSPQMPLIAVQTAGGMRQQGAMLFLSRIEKKHPDPEVRAWALLRRVEDAENKHYVTERKKIGQQLVKNYPETSAAKFVKARFPYDFD
ncbi:MAG: hypothetical protein LBH03_04780 [Holophagales bacterium]|jgi:hypothetical protein|nr:hypothetical protein [Holophagales bacterium]